MSPSSPSATCPNLSQPLTSPLQPYLCCSKASPKYPWGAHLKSEQSLLTSLGSSLQPAAEGRGLSRGMAGLCPMLIHALLCDWRQVSSPLWASAQ